MESNIRKLRREQKISQSELAEAIGISQQVISRMEKDRSRIRVCSLIALADYFCVSTDEILGYTRKAGKDRPEYEKAPDHTEWDEENEESRVKAKPMPESGQSAVYELLVSVKRCLEECGI